MLETTVRFDYPLANPIGMYAQEFHIFYQDGQESFASPERILYTTMFDRIVIKSTDYNQAEITYYKDKGKLHFSPSGQYLEYNGKKYDTNGALTTGYVDIFGKFDPVKNINKDWFKPWFDSSNSKATNDLALDSLRKTIKAAAIHSHNKVPDALSFKNIEGIKKLNKYQKLFNKIISDWKNLGILEADTPLQPILSDEQLLDLSNKLAGEAGEELVDEAVKIDNKKFHNVILDYNYGNKQNTSANNQIDNIFITHTGIYCVEVKTRNVKNGIFDMRDLADQGIKDQIGYHKDAVLNVLRDPNNHLKDILPENLSSLIYNVVVIINRQKKDFQIANADELTRFGAHVLKLEDLNLAMTNGLKEDIYLTDEQIDKIARSIEKKNIGAKGERVYSDNIVFFNDTKKGNNFTLSENDVLNRWFPITLYRDLTITAIKAEKKKDLLRDQREMLDFVELAMKPFIYTITLLNDPLMNDMKNPLSFPEIKSNHEYDDLFDEQKKKLKMTQEGFNDFDIDTKHKYYQKGTYYNLKDAAKYYDNHLEKIMEREEEKRKLAKAEKTVEKATNFNKTNSDINDFLDQKSQGSSCLSSAALIALIVGIIPALLHILL